VFGYASSETESARNPELLTRGFLKLGQIVDALVSGDHFIVIGNKGSGKSAIAEHLKLSADNIRMFVNVTRLSEFPYSDLRNVVEGERPEEVLPLAWSWLLLLNFLASFVNDQGGNAEINPQLFSFVQNLQSIGLLPSAVT
jgi:hypothetical protein